MRSRSRSVVGKRSVQGRSGERSPEKRGSGRQSSNTGSTVGTEHVVLSLFVVWSVCRTPEKDGVLFEIPEYSYGLWVTNLGLTPLKTEEFYNKRAVAENLIGAGKNQMAFGSMLVHEFWANHALLQASVFAYNLMIWFQRMTLDAHRWRERPNTLRAWLIYLAARLLYTDNSWVLALGRGYPHQDEWERMENRLAALNFA